MADEIVIHGGEEFVRKLTTFKSLTRLSGFNGQRWMRKACLRVIGNVKMKQLAHQTGAPLPNQLTSRHPGPGLEGHIHEQVEVQGNTLIGRVGVGTEIPYARIHELGGAIGSHGKRSFERFTASAAGTTGFHQMPRRPYFGPALEAERTNIQKDFDNEVHKAIEQVGLA